MSYLRCGQCGVTIADRAGDATERPCPRCMLQRRVIVRMELQPPQAAGTSSSVLGSPLGSNTFARRGRA
jgi:hypothetical protein